MISKQLLYYGSKLDNVLQPLPLSITDNKTEKLALVLDVSPGAINDLERSLNNSAEYAGYILEAGESAIVAKPCGRGPGSVYQGPGEVDLFEAVAFIQGNFPVDPDRISLIGGSMGGAAVWYLASHYPDFFADMLHIFAGKQVGRQFDSDISLVLSPLPKVPILFCYWRPEDGLESDFHLFFDSTVENNLTVDSIYLLTTGLLIMFEKIALRHN